MVIEPGSLKELVKAHDDAELKWAKNAQGKEMGLECPRRKKWAKEAYEQWNGLGKPKVV